MHAKAKTHFVVEIILKILMALKCPAKSNHLSLPSPSFFLSICLLPLARPQFASDRPVAASYNQKNKIFTPSKAQSAGFICFHCGCYVVALFTSVYIRTLPFFLSVLPSYYVFKFALLLPFSVSSYLFASSISVSIWFRYFSRFISCNFLLSVLSLTQFFRGHSIALSFSCL